ncbi:MAG: SPOR domain-containing protein [Alphaproteobacteria bacterium]
MPSDPGLSGTRDPLRAIYEHEQRRPRRSRLFTGAVSVLMLGAVALVVYYAYQMGLRAGAQGPAPLIKAEQQPYKVKPDEPGGMDVPNQDKLIYKEVTTGGSGDNKKPVERLMPQPEAPLPKPIASAQAIPQAEAAQLPEASPPPAAPAPMSPTVSAAAAATPSGDTPPPKEQAAKQVAQGGGLEAPSPPAKSGSSAQPGKAGSAGSTGQSAAKPAATGDAAPEAKPAATGEAPAAKPEAISTASVQKAPASASSQGGGWHVQLGAVRSNEEAQHEWARLQGKYQDMLGSLTLNVQRVDLGGGKGVYFRIRGGPIGERAEANALCDRLKAVQVGCLAVRP